jgi:hypothetical protein
VTLDPCFFDIRGNLCDYCPARVTMRGVSPVGDGSAYPLVLRGFASQCKWVHESYDVGTGVWVLRVDHLSSFPIRPPSLGVPDYSREERPTRMSGARGSSWEEF